MIVANRIAINIATTSACRALVLWQPTHNGIRFIRLMAQGWRAFQFFSMMQIHTARKLHAAVCAAEIRFKHDASPGAVAPRSGVVKAVSAGHLASVVRHQSPPWLRPARSLPPTQPAWRGCWPRCRCRKPCPRLRTPRRGRHNPEHSPRWISLRANVTAWCSSSSKSVAWAMRPLCHDYLSPAAAGASISTACSPWWVPAKASRRIQPSRWRASTSAWAT